MKNRTRKILQENTGTRKYSHTDMVLSLFFLHLCATSCTKFGAAARFVYNVYMPSHSGRTSDSRCCQLRQHGAGDSRVCHPACPQMYLCLASPRVNLAGHPVVSWAQSFVQPVRAVSLLRCRKSYEWAMGIIASHMHLPSRWPT